VSVIATSESMCFRRQLLIIFAALSFISSPPFVASSRRDPRSGPFRIIVTSFAVAYSRNSSSAVISAIHNDSPAMRSAFRDKIAHLTRLHLIDDRAEARGGRRRRSVAANGATRDRALVAAAGASSYRGSGSATYTRRGPFSQQFICSHSFHLAERSATSRIRLTARSRRVFFGLRILRGIIGRNVAWQYPSRIICM